jgi:hypothetical protein
MFGSSTGLSEEQIVSFKSAPSEGELSRVKPSQFTRYAFFMPTGQGGTYENFSFLPRRHLQRIYDTPAQRLLLCCGRQTEKSTLLGNIGLCYTCLVPAHLTLYVSPSATQTKTFSNDRLREPIETSRVLRRFTTHMLSQNVFEKQFVNRSKVTLRYAFLNADRTRGIPAHLLEIDEFQDIMTDNVPVIEQCLSHAPEHLKRYIYAGTPKSLDNPLEQYRAKLSTQGEWVVPCDGCGSAKGAGRYWNVLGEKNIGKQGLVCERCGRLISAQHQDAQWAFGAKYHPVNTPFEGYRISQLMVPWKPWNEVLLQHRTYSRARFYNEVLGLSYDSGLRPLTKVQIQACCNPDVYMSDVAKYRPLSFEQPFFAGIDWGCHDEQTRVLTDNGFKYFRELTDDDLVAQWEPEGRLMTFVRPRVRTVRRWTQPLIQLSTRGGVDMAVTHTHRMRVGANQGKYWLTESAGEMAKRGGNVKLVGHIVWRGEEQATFTLPGLPTSAGYKGSQARTLSMDDWLEFVGYMVTEGGVCHDKGRVSCLKMSQRVPVNQEVANKIKACMTRLAIPYKEFKNDKTGDLNWTICGKQYWRWFVENTGELCAGKRLPRALLGLGGRQLRILFEAMVDGDGSRDYRDPTRGSFCSTSRGLCDDFQELCIKLGMRCVVRPHAVAAGNRKARWRAGWSKGRDYALTKPSMHVERVPYDGQVYCCSVPSGYIVTERNGCVAYQGNTGENTYTVLTLATYVDMKFRFLYAHRFIGEDIDPEPQMKKIIEIIKFFNVRTIGTDYGGGFDRNDTLMRAFGPERVYKFQYASRPRKKVDWSSKLRRWIVHRTEVMSDVFNAIKRGRDIQFPRWEEMETPYAQDMLNIFSEHNEQLRMIMYKHGRDMPDDSFHSVLYCLLGSMVVYPRPDLIAPRKEDPRTGRVIDDYQMVNQG